MTDGLPTGEAPPNDQQAEQSVLGGMLLSTDIISDVIEIVTLDDFYAPKHRVIFDKITELFSQGTPADPVTVAAALSDSGDLMRVGGVPYLHTLTERVPTAVNAPYYARIVAEKGVLRRLVEVGTKVAQLGQNSNRNGLDLAATVDLAQQAIFEVTATRSRDDFSSFAEMLQPTLDGIEAAGAADQDALGVPTGFRDLDRLIAGFHPGQLIIVAGRPGLGKSTAGIDFMRHASIRAGMASCLFSLEMSKTEIVTRMLSAEARIPLHLLRTGNLDDNDWARLARRLGDVTDAPIFVDDSPAMTLTDIRAKARRLKQRHNLKMIVVDYLQLMTSPKRTESRQQEVSDLSRGLKLLAKEVECPVIAMSQLNRGPEQRQDKRPQLSDLRESGSIEQDADVVILLHRDDYYDKESARAGEADFIVAKHRNGPTDTITVAAQLHLSRFVDMALPDPA